MSTTHHHTKVYNENVRAHLFRRNDPKYYGFGVTEAEWLVVVKFKGHKELDLELDFQHKSRALDYMRDIPKTGF